MIRTVRTGGIGYLTPIEGGDGWYWGSDYTSGDLYEAEELYRDGHPISRDRLILAHWPEGRAREPVAARDGQYFGIPSYDNGAPVLLLVDFPAGEIRLLRYDSERDDVTPIAVLPLSSVEDCYNLMLHRAPLCLTRQTAERFQIVWPDSADFSIHPAETFCFRDDRRLYFSRWYEDPDYREEVVVRRFPDGAVFERFPGGTCAMPDGSQWLLTE